MDRFVSKPSTFQMFRKNGTTRPVSAVWTWSETDPFEVILCLTSPEQAMNWVMSRELLAAGLDGPAGLGDISVLPTLDEPNRLELVISNGTGHTACFRIPRGPLVAFLRATERVVPIGAEVVNPEVL